MQDCSLQQPYVLPATGIVSFGIVFVSSKIVSVRGCNRVRGASIKWKSLGAPFERVETQHVTCGFSETVTASLSATEKPIDVRRSALLTLLDAAPVAAGAAVLAAVMVQWDSGVALQQSLAALSVAACRGDDVLEQPIGYSGSPLQLVLGTGSGRYARGAVVGNIVLCLAAVTVGCLVVASSGGSYGWLARRLVPLSLLQWRRRRCRVGCSRWLRRCCPRRRCEHCAAVGWGGNVVLGVCGLLGCAVVAAWLCRLLCVRAADFRARPVRVRRRRPNGLLAQAATALTGRDWQWRDSVVVVVGLASWGVTGRCSTPTVAGRIGFLCKC